MARPPEPEGRKVREYNAETKASISAAYTVLVKTLGNTDPLVYHRAIKEALLLYKDAEFYTNEIDKICTLAARRPDLET